MGMLSRVWSAAAMKICAVNSGEINGLPPASRLIAGRNLSASNWSRVIKDVDSESAPRRITIMLSGELVSLIEELSPVTIAIAATKTPTTIAIAPVVIRLETRRMRRLLLLYLNGMAILVNQSERLDDGAARGRPGGNIRAQKTPPN